MGLVRSVLLVVLGSVLVFRPGGAAADVLVRRDALGDVERSPIGTLAWTPTPTRVEGDITSTRVAHGRRAIWIQVRLRDLTTGSNGNFFLVSVRSDRRFRSVTIDAFPDHWDGRATTTTARGVVVGCPVGHRLDYDRNRLTLRIPRSCLGNPQWVRVGVRSTVAGATQAYSDDARATGMPGTLAYGPRVRR